MNEIDDLIFMFEELDKYSDRGIKVSLNFSSKHTGEINKEEEFSYNLDALVCQIRRTINDSIKYRTLVQVLSDFSKGGCDE